MSKISNAQASISNLLAARQILKFGPTAGGLTLDTTNSEGAS